jgi:hypothetical protein
MVAHKEGDHGDGVGFQPEQAGFEETEYGVITLVPKVREANTIRQYIPICLLNVDFKIFPKLLIDMISPMSEKLISKSQTAFIKGRNILEGVVTLHEVIHELKITGEKVCYLR